MTGLRHQDDGGIVLGWLFRVALVLSLLGVAAFDVIAIGVAHVGIEDVASEAAFDAAHVPGPKLDAERAKVAASRVASDADARLDAFTLAADGTATVTVSQDVDTLVVRYLSPLRRFTVTSATASHTPVR